jgi:PAS domain S-box-containing protein
VTEGDPDKIVQLVVEACPNGIVMIDANGNILLVNAEADRIFG